MLSIGLSTHLFILQDIFLLQGMYCSCLFQRPEDKLQVLQAHWATDGIPNLEISHLGSRQRSHDRVIADSTCFHPRSEPFSVYPGSIADNSSQAASEASHSDSNTKNCVGKSSESFTRIRGLETPSRVTARLGTGLATWELMHMACLAQKVLLQGVSQEFSRGWGVPVAQILSDSVVSFL